MLHPQIDTVLALPESVADCGFVLSTNGTVRPDLDSMLVQYEWLVAISLHGMESTHNRYTLSRDFTHVKKRIENLARKTIVHIYTTLHDEMTYEDLEWLFRFRDESGASFLRFVIPRQFGRYRPLSRTDLLDHLAERIDDRAGIKAERSNTRFATVDGTIRSTS
jgi:sulfatase maturation enzyme AslB (radical SAM superfamily)